MDPPSRSPFRLLFVLLSVAHRFSFISRLINTSVCLLFRRKRHTTHREKRRKERGNGRTREREQCRDFTTLRIARYMGEAVALFKVLVVRGKGLVVRDFTSSDPYVVLKLGSQSAKTKVINSCLNPVWNEEFTFSVTEPVGILNLEVFDKDRFKADDKMGRTHLNLQPIASAARMKQVLQFSAGETKIRKLVPTTDNCLVRDSFISCINGEIVLDVWLRLCDVESGELELKIKWVDLTSNSSAVAAIPL